MKHIHKYNNNLSFIDMLFIMVLGFVFLLVLSVRLMNPPTKKNDIESRAEILIVMKWPDNSPHDIDLWCLTPDLEKIGFQHREGTYVHLDRDDLGQSNDLFVVPGTSDFKVIEINREAISVRARKPGRYVVNVYFFARKRALLNRSPMDESPVPVEIELLEVHPRYKIVTKQTVILTKVMEERTAFVFTIGATGEIENVETTEELFLLNEFNRGGGGAGER